MPSVPSEIVGLFRATIFMIIVIYYVGGYVNDVSGPIPDATGPDV
jgi:hypothetical protein